MNHTSSFPFPDSKRFGARIPGNMAAEFSIMPRIFYPWGKDVKTFTRVATYAFSNTKR